MSDLFDDGSLAIFERQIDEWLAKLKSVNETILAIDHGDPDPLYRARWYVRMKGETKDYITVWLTLGQRTLRYETYVLPAPEENIAEFNENLLRRNDKLIGAHFSVGLEDAVYLCRAVFSTIAGYRLCITLCELVKSLALCRRTRPTVQWSCRL